MPKQRHNGFSLLTSTVLIAAAGAGAMLGAMPDLPAAPTPLTLVSLPLVGAALWLRRLREHRIAARLRHLRLSVSLPMPPGAPLEGVLAFRPIGSGLWQARRDGWQINLRQDSSTMAWQLLLARLDNAEPALPLATAATLDALLRLARGLLWTMTEPGLVTLLDCDLCFPLPAPITPEESIIALAEGGYALQGREGCCALAAGLAEQMIRRGSAVPAPSF